MSARKAARAVFPLLAALLFVPPAFAQFDPPLNFRYEQSLNTLTLSWNRPNDWFPASGVFNYDVTLTGPGVNFSETTQSNSISFTLASNLVPAVGATVTWQATATARSTERSTTATLSVVFLGPPRAPGNLRALRDGARVVLTWDAPANTEKYWVFRAAPGEDFSDEPILDSTNTTNARYVDTPPDSSRDWDYTVQAINAGLQRGPLAARVESRVVAPPDAPTKVTTSKSKASDNRDFILLDWDRPSGGPAPAGYWVERSRDGGGWTWIAETVPANSHYSDYDYTPSLPGTWRYRVRAFAGGTVGPPSDEATVTANPTCDRNNDAHLRARNLRFTRAFESGTWTFTFHWDQPVCGIGNLFRVTLTAGGSTTNCGNFGNRWCSSRDTTLSGGIDASSSQNWRVWVRYGSNTDPGVYTDWITVSTGVAPASGVRVSKHEGGVLVRWQPPENHAEAPSDGWVVEVSANGTDPVEVGRVGWNEHEFLHTSPGSGDLQYRVRWRLGSRLGDPVNASETIEVGSALDVNGDESIDASDALILYYAFSLRSELGTGR